MRLFDDELSTENYRRFFYVVVFVTACISMDPVKSLSLGGLPECADSTSFENQ